MLPPFECCLHNSILHEVSIVGYPFTHFGVAHFIIQFIDKKIWPKEMMLLLNSVEFEMAKRNYFEYAKEANRNGYGSVTEPKNKQNMTIRLAEIINKQVFEVYHFTRLENPKKS